MQLPYTVSPPSWTKNGLHSLNTRPFLAVHRRKYNNIPRLFPTHPHAEQLFAPVVSFDKSAHEGQAKGTRLKQRNQLVVSADEPHEALMRSPGVSDVEMTYESNFLDHSTMGELDQSLDDMLQSAKRALQETRYIQRKSWRDNASMSIATPISAQENVINYALSEGFESSSKAAIPNDLFEEPEEKKWPGARNPLSVIDIGNERALACALTGLLDSLAVYSLKTASADDSKVYQYISRKGCLRANDVIVHDTEPVTDVVTSGWEMGSAEPGLVFAFTNNSVNVASISVSGDDVSMRWEDQAPFPTTFSCALNPLFPTEFAALCREGLFLGSLSSYKLYLDSAKSFDHCFHDIQCIAEQSPYTNMCYGAHPRSLLLSNQKEIVMFDVRAPVNLESRNVLCNIRDHWNISRHDPGISIFKPLRSRSHTMIAVTQTCINYVDLRMPQEPLLDWTLSLPSPVEQACITNLDSGPPISDVIAFASRRNCYLEVFHAVHEQRQANPGFRPLRVDENGRVDVASWKPPSIPRRSVLWSDLPLSHLQQLRGDARVSGMALLPLEDQRRVSLLQWSAKDGLIAQLLDVTTEGDGSSVAEAAASRRENIRDSTLNMKNYQMRLYDCGEIFPLRRFIKPVTHGLGNRLLFRSQRLHAQDAWEIRGRVFNDDDDDVNAATKVRFPRVHLGDIALIHAIRNCISEERRTDRDAAASTDLVARRSRKSSSSNSSKKGHSSDSLLDFDSDSVDSDEREQGQGELLDYQGTQEAVSGDISHVKRKRKGREHVNRRKRARPDSTEETVNLERAITIAKRKNVSSSISSSGTDSSPSESADKSHATDGAKAGQKREALPPTQSSANVDEESESVSSGSSSDNRSVSLGLSTSSESSASTSDSSASNSSDSSKPSTSSRSESLGSSDTDEDMGDLMTEIGSGATLDEIGRIVRSGMAHSSTPLGPQELQKTIEDSAHVQWYDVEWHAGCGSSHEEMPWAVTTDGQLPDWVHTRVYYTEDAEPGEALSNAWIREGSAHWEFVERMKDFFFDEEDKQ